MPADLQAVTTPIRDSMLENAAAWLIALVAVLTALGWLARKAYRAFKMGETAFLELIGTDEHPSLRKELAEVKAIALRSEKELHPNGGSSLRDDVRSVSKQVEQVQEAAQQATTAAGLAVNEAKVAANVAQETAVERRGDVRRMQQAMDTMREDIAQDAAEKTAAAFELLAERTANRTDGPIDLRGPVPPHAHALPPRIDPTLTGGPVAPDAEETPSPWPPEHA